MSGVRIITLERCTLLCVLFLSACSTRQPEKPVATLVAFPGTPTVQCVQEEVMPKIERVEPAEPRPGSEVRVIASGGYLRDSCGAYNESARSYKIYFDDEPVADLSCYVNHCEGKFVLAENVSAGPHCMGVQKGSCQVEIRVAAQ